MKWLKRCLVGLLLLALLVPPVEARPRRRNRGGRGGSGAGIVLGVIAAAAAAKALSDRQHRRDAWRYNAYPVYGAPVPRYCPFPGAVTYIDEGEYRNYRDAYDNFLGRVPLYQIPPGFW